MTITPTPDGDGVEGDRITGVLPSEPNPPVHPLAAAFPMMDREDLDALADDMSEHGLRNPIVLDSTGQLIDGRNRLAACKLAGIEPRFVTTHDEPLAYILSANVTRRHLSKSQQAMAYAKAYPEVTSKGGRGQKLYSENTVSRDYISKARFVLHNAPDLADKVMAGSSLPEAYTLAAEQAREREQFAQLRTDVGDHVDAIVSVCARLKSDIDKPTAFLDQEDFIRQVRVDVKEIIGYANQLTDQI